MTSSLHCLLLRPVPLSSINTPTTINTQVLTTTQGQDTREMAIIQNSPHYKLRPQTDQMGLHWLVARCLLPPCRLRRPNQIRSRTLTTVDHNARRSLSKGRGTKRRTTKRKRMRSCPKGLSMSIAAWRRSRCRRDPSRTRAHRATSPSHLLPIPQDITMCRRPSPHPCPIRTIPDRP